MRLSSTLGSAGGYTIPEILSADLIDLMRAKSRVMEAGAKTFTMESADQLFAKLTADPSPSWLHEGAEMTETAPTFGQIRFTARTLRMLVKVPRELLEDSINLNGKLPTIFAAAMAGELDRVALLGSGEGAEPLGVLNFTDINSVSMGDNGAELADYSPLIDAIYEIEVDNAETPTTAIMHPPPSLNFPNWKIRRGSLCRGRTRSRRCVFSRHPSSRLLRTRARRLANAAALLSAGSRNC